MNNSCQGNMQHNLLLFIQLFMLMWSHNVIESVDSAEEDNYTNMMTRIST